jgi:hypothetical protein
MLRRTQHDTSRPALFTVLLVFYHSHDLLLGERMAYFTQAQVLHSLELLAREVLPRIHAFDATRPVSQ